MLNLIKSMFTNSSTNKRITIITNRDTRAPSQRAIIKSYGTKKQAMTEMLRRGVPMTVREISNLAGFKMAYVAATLQQDSKLGLDTRSFKKAPKRRCTYSDMLVFTYQLSKARSNDQ
jgi:hypothetical protein